MHHQQLLGSPVQYFPPALFLWGHFLIGYTLARCVNSAAQQGSLLWPQLIPELFFPKILPKQWMSQLCAHSSEAEHKAYRLHCGADRRILHRIDGRGPGTIRRIISCKSSAYVLVKPPSCNRLRQNVRVRSIFRIISSINRCADLFDLIKHKPDI